ncbi:PGF-CTERM sorting domain-containing protein [Paraburkholderia tropica]|uniref:PGF-CTERM sorting domain-containing protein n=1 Tax=Paraburkholderia tropica TaxID=92647 RepID=UPI00399CDA37
MTPGFGVKVAVVGLAAAILTQTSIPSTSVVTGIGNFACTTPAVPLSTPYVRLLVTIDCRIPAGRIGEPVY